MTFIIKDKSIPSDPTKTLLELSSDTGIIIPSSCKNQGKCKECLVEITKGMEHLSPVSIDEKHLGERYRLSCQAKIIGNQNAEVVANLLERPMLKIQEKGVKTTLDVEINPAVYIKNNNIYLDDNIIDAKTGKIHGLAIDIGTTTIVIRTIDLVSGELVSSVAFENPQRFAGTNVMARIVYDTDNGKKELNRVLTAYMSNVILGNKIENSEIYEVVVGGNTTMRDLFFGLNVFTIGQSPYYSLSEIDLNAGKIETTSLTQTGKKIKLPIHPKARVYGLPIIGGHVGADTAACILAVNMMESDELIVIMDIGTNTEIVIGNKDKILVASSPSGPAFEGGGIICGMPALNGAIEKVKINNNKIEIKTVGNAEPIGICGSGLIDIMGEMLRNDIINMMGRFEDDKDYINITNDGKVFLNEHDINLLAQTKGSNSAALSILFKQYGIDFNAIDKFYLAGGFGQHIDIEAGIRIGMLPNIHQDKFIKIGNATIEGLSIALLSKPKRDKLEKFVKKIKQVNLESDPDFFDYFVDGCMFSEIMEI